MTGGLFIDRHVCTWSAVTRDTLILEISTAGCCEYGIIVSVEGTDKGEFFILMVRSLCALRVPFYVFACKIAFYRFLTIGNVFQNGFTFSFAVELREHMVFCRTGFAGWLELLEFNVGAGKQAKCVID